MMQRTLTLKVGLLASLVFFATGYLTLLFMPLEGIAATIFPPVGIGVALVMVYGRGILAWLALASLLINVSVSSSLTAPDAPGLLVAFGTTLASMLQIGLGAELLRRWVGYPLSLDTGLKTLKFVATPLLFCLVASSLSSLTLMLAGRLPLEGLPGFWLTWWLGDSLAVLLFTPLVLLHIGEVDPYWKAWRARIGLLTLVGLSLIMLASAQSKEMARQERLAGFHLISQHLSSRLIAGIEEQAAFLDNLALVMAGRHIIDAEDFQRFSQAALRRYATTLQAIEWAPKIEAHERKGFEQEMARDHAGFRITERAPAAGMVVAAPRERYLPVSFLVPLAGNEAALGYDLLSQVQRRDTIERARLSGEALLSPPLHLVQERGEQSGLLLVRWVKQGTNGPGLVLVVLRVGDFLNSLMRDLEPGMGVRLSDLDASKILFDTFEPAGIPADDRTFELLGRSYRLETMPLQSSAYAASPWQSWLVAIGGLSLLAVLNLFVLLSNSRAAKVEVLVNERTLELEWARQQAEQASSLLHEAVESIALGFTIYDPQDRLVVSNEAYRKFYSENADRIVPGMSFEEVVRAAAEDGLYRGAEDDLEGWLAQRLEQHGRADGSFIEQQLSDGTWLLLVEHRTPSGYIVSNHLDITTLKQTSEELRQRELYLRATLDNLPFFFWLKDRQSRFLAVNKVFADACGRSSPDEVVGLTDLDVWPRELAERYRADDAWVMDQREVIAVEEPVAGGSEAGWIETYKKPVINDEGEVIGNVGFARDISDRKKIEQELAETRQRWELAIAGSNDGIWDWDAQSNRVFFSERWKTMLGYAPEEIGDSVNEWIDRIHPEDREATLALVQRHLDGETQFYQSEHRLLCKDGSYKWILDRGQALFDESGKAVRVAGSHTDISERREAEDRLRDHTEQLNGIFALSPDGFIAFDADNRIKYVSSAVSRLTGFGEAELVGLDEQAFSRLLADACQDQGRFRGVESLRHVPQASASGKRYLIELAGVGKRVLQVGLRESRGGSVSQILYFRDVTHEVEVERIKSEFLSTAAHELRTPMASIYGFTELLMAREFDTPTQHEFLSTIFRQSELMITIINELLDLARIEARGGKDFEYQQLNPCSLCREAVDGFKPPDQRERPLMSKTECDCTIKADRNKLIQALGNVLSNAYKYSPEGGPVEIDFLSAEAEGPYAGMIGIRVRDQGIGMTPQQLERVCERFYRADTSGKIPGTGLGMSIVKEILQQHGGDLAIDSEAGKGTWVTLWIPSTAQGCR
ncbi:MAG: PAS domain S-box protein [Gammaproteobacteria bacterium SHHR-1]